MNRRQVIACVAAALAGCSSGDGDTPTSADTDTASPTPIETATPTLTRTPSPSPTPTPRPAQFELVDISVPRSTVIGKTLAIDVIVENTGGRSGSLETQVYVKSGDSTPTAIGTLQFGTVPPGETATESATFITPKYLLELEFSVGAFDGTRTVELLPRQLSFGTSFETPGGSLVIVQGVDFVPDYEWKENRRTYTTVAPEGKKWCFTRVYAANVTDEPIELPTAEDFSAVYDRTQYETAEYHKDNAYVGGEVEPDAVREGIVNFAVPEDASSDEIEVVLSEQYDAGSTEVSWSG